MLQINQMNQSMSTFESNISSKIEALDQNYQNLNIRLEKMEKEQEEQRNKVATVVEEEADNESEKIEIRDEEKDEGSVTSDVNGKTASDFGQESGDPNVFDVKKEYVWNNDTYDLPVQIKFGFTFKTEGELIPAWSENKNEWGGKCDALTWYMGTNRHDFTFRTEMFGGFPSIERPQPGFNAEIDKRYQMVAKIYPDRAEYSIDGELYAKATYDEGKVPLQGTFGFAIYSGDEHKIIDSVDIKELKN